MLDRPEFQQALRFIFEEKVPFCKVLGLKFTFALGHAEVAFAKQDFMLGNTKLKVLHGGVTASVLDSIAGTAVFLKLAEVNPQSNLETQLRMLGAITTIDLRIDYLEPANAAAFVASATVTRLGKRVAIVQMTMHDDTGTCVATGAAAFAVRPPRVRRVGPRGLEETMASHRLAAGECTCPISPPTQSDGSPPRVTPMRPSSRSMGDLSATG
jgi:uncharacterized protein (TIGR00369 family)